VAGEPSTLAAEPQQEKILVVIAVQQEQAQVVAATASQDPISVCFCVHTNFKHS
jgi:hypothetical protein